MTSYSSTSPAIQSRLQTQQNGSVESYAHRFAKEVVADWLRARAEFAGGYEECASFGDLVWRVNRSGPHFGVWLEYPITICGVGYNPVWDEYNDSFKFSPPSYDWLLAHDLRPRVILDVAVQHKGNIIAAIEIKRKHAVSSDKRAFLESRAIELIETPAAWILGQVRMPTGLLNVT